MGKRDRRALVLGTAFLVVASVFADQLLTPFRAMTSPTLTVARGIFALQPDAFTPYFIWLFVRDFPRASDLGTGRRRLRIMANVSFFVGVFFVAGNLLEFVASLRPDWAPLWLMLHPLSRHNNGGFYWPTQFALSIAALPVLLWRARGAPLPERRRASLLVWGLVAGTMPTILWVLLTATSPTVRALMPLRIAGWVLYPALLSTPVTTAYAVLVRHALDVRLVVRRAVRYVLARYSVIALALAPAVLLGVSAYRRRYESLAGLVWTAETTMLFVLSIVGVVALVSRRSVLERIDRRFFREEYDSRRILGRLVDQCRLATGRRELAEVLGAEIDLALHVRGVHVFFLEPETQRFLPTDGWVRALSAQSALAQLAATGSGVINADVERSDTRVARLPDGDRHWLVDAGASLLLPLRDAERNVIGLLTVGEKRSELPFSSEDRALLAAVAAAAEMTIAYRGLEPRSPKLTPGASTTAPEPRAAECETCGAVHPAGTIVCARCASATRECLLPELVGAKFKIEQRIGVGGMGVVYRGTDLELDRPVAIKTLPFVFPDEAIRLRREARAMALVSHQHLAVIFGVETWQGRPMLVCEYLAGGTLETRIKAGPMSVPAALDLAIALSSALEAIHRAGVLHLDIKPSNIGFGNDGAPKILDFGIARILSATVAESRASSRRERDVSPLVEHLSVDGAPGSHQLESVIVGTPLYMSPEAMQGMPPRPAFDLWALSLVLYEAIAGRNPLRETRPERTAARILMCDIPDIRLTVPAAPTELAAFFHSALSHDEPERPASAKAFGEWLHRIRSTMPSDRDDTDATSRVSAASESPPGLSGGTESLLRQ